MDKKLTFQQCLNIIDKNFRACGVFEKSSAYSLFGVLISEKIVDK